MPSLYILKSRGVGNAALTFRDSPAHHLKTAASTIQTQSGRSQNIRGLIAACLYTFATRIAILSRERDRSRVNVQICTL